MDHFLKSLLNLLQYCFFFFYVLVFWLRAMWYLTPQPGMEPEPPALEGVVLTTGLPGKSPPVFIFLKYYLAHRTDVNILQ